MMQENTNSDNTSPNPFQLNLNEIKSAHEEASVPSRPESSEPQPTPQPEPLEQPQQVVSPPPEEPSVFLPVPQPQAQPYPQEHPPAPPRETTAARGTVIADAELWAQQKQVLFTSLPALAAILAYAYWWSTPTLGNLFNTWTNNVDYHHGFFVAPFVAYFLWVRRDTFPVHRGPWDAALGIILGTVLLLFWCVFQYYVMVWSMVTLDSWSILIWVWAVCLMCFGVRVFIWALPSLVFLAFMFPWPPRLEVLLRGPLQEFAAQLSVYILRVVGEPAIAQSNVVLMSDNQRLDVAAACSGIRVLVSVIAAAYAAVLLMRRPWWQNLLLFCMVVPVALFVNALRIAMTGLLIKYASGGVAGLGFEKPTPVVCDEISGMVMLMLTFVFFVAIIWWFGKVFCRVDVATQQTRIRQVE
jgi:exosortase